MWNQRIGRTCLHSMYKNGLWVDGGDFVQHEHILTVVHDFNLVSHTFSSFLRHLNILCIAWNFPFKDVKPDFYSTI